MKGTVAQLGVGLLHLGRRGHHDGTIPCDRLLDRLAGHEQEPDARVSCLDRDGLRRSLPYSCCVSATL